MTDEDLNRRYHDAMRSVNYEKTRKSAQSYAAGAAILVAKESLEAGTLGKLAFASRLFLVVFAIFVAFYFAGQVGGAF